MTKIRIASVALRTQLAWYLFSGVWCQGT